MCDIRLTGPISTIKLDVTATKKRCNERDDVMLKKEKRIFNRLKNRHENASKRVGVITCVVKPFFP